jgi:hypothetical protein
LPFAAGEVADVTVGDLTDEKDSELKLSCREEAPLEGATGDLGAFQPFEDAIWNARRARKAYKIGQ